MTFWDIYVQTCLVFNLFVLDMSDVLFVNRYTFSVCTTNLRVHAVKPQLRYALNGVKISYVLCRYF